MLQIAPIRTEIIETEVNPCAVINAFIPKVSCTKSVPNAYKLIYEFAYEIVFSLAPKARSKSLFQTRITTVKIREITTCTVTQPPRIFSADSCSPFPIAIEARGAPPELINAANADTIIINGMHTPTPVSARLPSPGICPI